MRVAEGLRRRGIKAFSAAEKGQIGASDIEHFKYAADMEAVIFTHDHYFLEIANTAAKEGKSH